MRILVTGGAGFIGSHLVDALLKRGHQVAVIDDLSSGCRENVSEQATFFEVDIRNADEVSAAFQEFQPEAVSHQAAQMSVSLSVREPAFDAEVNVLGLINIASATMAVGARRLVFAASGGTLYGEVTEPADENSPACPISPYGISKWAGERYLSFFEQEHGLSSTALRYANVYGARQNPHGEAGVVAIFCTRLFRGEPATINGDGKYLRDYVHVSDVVRNNVAALESNETGFDAVNVGTGVATDVNELAGKIHKFCEEELERRGSSKKLDDFGRGPARAGDIRSNLLCYDKACSKWNLPAPVSLNEGLRETVSWFADQIASESKQK